MNMRVLKRGLLVGLGVLNIQWGLSQVDNYSKNKKISEDAELVYNKELEANPNSAKPHWNYANVMAKFEHNAYKNAWKYYIKALDIDSISADIYVDFGDYLINRLEDFESASLVLKKGLTFNENHSVLMQKISQVERKLEEEKDFVFTKPSQYNEPSPPYSELTDFEKLNEEVKNKKSPYYYSKLLKQFLSDKTLTNREMYMLLIGYTQTEDYNPYNYKEIEKLYALGEAKKYKEAVKKAKELLKVNPVNSTIYGELIYCYKQLKETELVEKYRKRRTAIFDAMLYSGNGSKEEPYVTIAVKEEYAFVNYMGLKEAGDVNSGLVNGIMVDQLFVVHPKSNKKGSVHFNISTIFANTMNRMKSK